MYIEEPQEEQQKLWELCDDKDEKIKFLAKYVRRIIQAIDRETDYELEQRERGTY